MKRLTTICTGLFILFVFSFLAYQRQHKPRILVVHSYNVNMPWVQSLNLGMRNIFEDKAYISLRYFYMDAKHHSSYLYQQRIGKALSTTIDAWQPDIVIAFDEEAQNIVVKQLSASKNIRAILAGITDSKRWMEYEKIPHITGITEQIPVRAIREILSLIFRSQRRIYYLSDDSIAARTLDKTLTSQDWGSYELVAHKRVKTFAQWQAAVREAQETADILLVSIYHTIVEGKKQVKSKRLVSWMNEHSHIPVVGVYESFIIDGGMLAIAISSIEQGYTAAWLALNIIEKKLSIEDVPLLHGKTFSLFMNKEALLKRFPKVHIPIILDAFSKSHWGMDALSSPEIDLSTIERLRLKTVKV